MHQEEHDVCTIESTNESVHTVCISRMNGNALQEPCGPAFQAEL